LTVLFTDIVGSTEVAARLGDERWRSLLGRYRTLIRRDLRRFHGQEIDTAGDGFFATFTSPTQAVNCALTFMADIVELGVQARTSVHQGACEMRGEKVSGLTIHVGARILGLARDGEVLVSQAVSDSVFDEAIRFDDRGSHALRGVPDVWSLYAVNARADR
jgi:class 3 adenylate cyclase